MEVKFRPIKAADYTGLNKTFSFESKQKKMDQKIKLTHPAGKKAVSIDKGKYDALKKAILNYLNTKGEATHPEILQAINEDFKKNKTRFEGSINWHLEWVKLDLEARKEIKRISNKSPIKFTIAGRDSD
ncbi:MAG: hypothetical protein WAL29_00265 [Bacteroidales bacterium]